MAMTPEKKREATRRLFELLGLSGSAHFSVNNRTREEVDLLIIALTPHIHGILCNMGVRDDHERREMAAGVALRLLTMKAPTAAAVENGMAYLAQVVSSERNTYVRDLITHRNLQRGLAAGSPVANQDAAPTEARPLTAGPGDKVVQRNDLNDDEDQTDVAGQEDPPWIRVHRRRLIARLRERLAPRDFELIALRAEGYSYREIVAISRGIPEREVRHQQEGALRQRLYELLEKIRNLLGDENF